MINLKHFTYFFIVVAMIIMIISMPFEADAKTGNVSKSVTILDGESYKLTVHNKPGRGIKWTSDNKKIVTVSNNGNVTGIKSGKGVIKAKLNGKIYKFKVKVESPKLSATNISIEQGEKYKLNVIGTTKKVRWSGGSYYVKVSEDGVVTGNAPGKGTIYAIVGKKEKTLKCHVKVTARKVDDSSLDKRVYSTGKSVVAIVKNNNNFNIEINGKTTFKDTSGNTITYVNAANPTLEPGVSTVLIMPFKSVFNDSYASYECVIKAYGSKYGNDQALNNLSVSYQKDIDYLNIIVKDNGADYSREHVVGVFFDRAGNCIGADDCWIHTDNPESADKCSFFLPSNTANYEVYVDYGDWFGRRSVIASCYSL